jgi:hypothetical protein
VRLLGRDLLGLLQVVDGFADLAPHGVCGGEVNQVADPGDLSLLIFGTYLA